MPVKQKVIINILDDTPIEMALAAVNLTVRTIALKPIPNRDIKQLIGMEVVHLDHIPSHKIERFDVWRHEK